MSKSIWMASHGAGVPQNDALTRYWCVSGYLAGPSASTSVNYPVRAAGTVGNLWAYVSANTINGNSVFTVQKSTVDTIITFTVGSLGTGAFSDDTHTATFASTDEILVKVVTSSVSGTKTITVKTLGVTFNADSGAESMLISTNGAATTASATTYYNVPGGRPLATRTDETNAKVRARQAFTAHNLWCYVSASSRTLNNTLQFRKNGGDGTQVITFIGTGTYEDTTHTDSVAAGDDFDVRFTTSAETSSVTISSMGVLLTSNNGYWMSILGDNQPSSLTSSTTYFAPLGGGGITTTLATVEAEGNILPQFDFTVKNLACYRSGGTTASGSIKLRKNLGDGTCVLTMPASTGLIEDTTHTDDFTGGTDEIGFQIGPFSATTGFSWISLLGFIGAEGGISATLSGTGSITQAALKGSGKLAGAMSGTGSFTQSRLKGSGKLAVVMSGEGVITQAALKGWFFAAATLSGVGSITQARLLGSGRLTGVLSGAGSITQARLLGAGRLAAIMSGVGSITQANLVDLGVGGNLAATLAGSGNIVQARITGWGLRICTMSGEGIITQANLKGSGKLIAALSGMGSITQAALKGAGRLSAVLSGVGCFAVHNTEAWQWLREWEDADFPMLRDLALRDMGKKERP